MRVALAALALAASCCAPAEGQGFGGRAGGRASGGPPGAPPPPDTAAPPPPYTVHVTVQLEAGHFETGSQWGAQGGRAGAAGRAAGTGADSGQHFVASTTPPETFSIHVHPQWAPIGAARFTELVERHFFDEARFFRVVPNFMVQFGLPADPARIREFERLTDDPVTQSNTRGYVSFAKTAVPDSRTTQLFINFGDNSGLDAQGFAPFGFVDADDMAVSQMLWRLCRQSPYRVSRARPCWLRSYTCIFVHVRA